MNMLAREEYLSREVLTATPQKLQLMLIDAALRFGERADRHLQAHEYGPAFELLIRCQDITAELLRGLASGVGTDLGQKIAAIYNFIYGALIEAARFRDRAKLADALRVLEIERQTWREVCEKLGTNAARAPHFDMQRVSSFSLEG
ncbi:MAG TPA: flagellar export chaperone FliS [Pirellulales bacterium]|nr:flagellar export chaperone FliS [Pirellulales bacterium]